VFNVAGSFWQGLDLCWLRARDYVCEMTLRTSSSVVCGPVCMVDMFMVLLESLVPCIIGRCGRDCWPWGMDGSVLFGGDVGWLDGLR
jgi:hypothetical protein